MVDAWILFLHLPEPFMIKLVYILGIFGQIASLLYSMATLSLWYGIDFFIDILFFSKEHFVSFDFIVNFFAWIKTYIISSNLREGSMNLGKFKEAWIISKNQLICHRVTEAQNGHLQKEFQVIYIDFYNIIIIFIIYIEKLN
jgi:hypothetical protein